MTVTRKTLSDDFLIHAIDFVLAKSLKPSRLTGAFFKMKQEMQADRWPSKADLAEAAAAWDALTEGEKRTIFNGWRVEESRPTVKEFFKAQTQYDDWADEAIPNLEITHNRYTNACNVGKVMEPGSDTSMVRIQVREGATKAEVLDSLRKMIAVLGSTWERAVGLPMKGGFLHEAADVPGGDSVETVVAALNALQRVIAGMKAELIAGGVR